ncbi:MAG: PAS domain S-box protein, partial [Candidatus Cloacimonas sp.]
AATESALHDGERQYRDLVENVNSIILRLDTEGQVVFLNAFGRHFFGYTEEEVLGRTALETIVPEFDGRGGDLRTMMQDIIHHPEAYLSHDNENMTKSGRYTFSFLFSFRHFPFSQFISYCYPLNLLNLNITT